MDTFGLDLGTSLIKAVQLKKDKGRVFLTAAGSISTPSKGLISESPLDQEAVAVAVKKLLADAKITIRQVNSALPDDKVFSQVIELPSLSEKELEQALRWEAEQYIPYPLDKVNLDFSILEKDLKKQKMQVLLVAAPLRLIEKYTNILKLAGLVPLALETEIIAVSRSVSSQASADQTVMVINFGSTATGFSIIRKGSFCFMGSIASGGEALTRAIAQELGFEMTRAEEYKKTYGLEEQSLEGKVQATIKPVIDTILAEIKKALSFHQEKYPREQVGNLVLTGGVAYLPGIASYFTQELGIETQIGNPWIKVQVDSVKFAEVVNESAIFAAATGLALRSLT